MNTTMGVSRGSLFPEKWPSLEQNIPNPCRELTSIGFYLPASDFITMRLCNYLGKEVWAQSQKLFPAGNNAIMVPLCHLAQGLYMYTMEGMDYCLTRKLIIR